MYRIRNAPDSFQLALARPSSGRMAFAEDGAKPPHANRDLARQSGVDISGRALGHSPSLDQDGEYFCRVLCRASEGTGSYRNQGFIYRAATVNRLSFVGDSDKKKDSLLLSMKLHVQYLRSLEDSERVRTACLKYLQTWYRNFLPGAALTWCRKRNNLRQSLGGRLEAPTDYPGNICGFKQFFGFTAAKQVRQRWNQFKSHAQRSWDKALFELEKRNVVPVMRNTKDLGRSAIRRRLKT